MDAGVTDHQGRTLSGAAASRVFLLLTLILAPYTRPGLMDIRFRVPDASPRPYSTDS